MADPRRHIKGSLEVNAVYIPELEGESNVTCTLALSAAGVGKLAMRIDGRLFLVNASALKALSIAANDVWGRR